MRRLQGDKSRMLLDRVRDELLPPERLEGMGGGTAGDNSGSQSIQDPDGRMLFMCGVSQCGGTDVCGE